MSIAPNTSPFSRWNAEDVRRAISPHIERLAKQWGVRFTGRVHDGWMECHAIQRDDNTPSAAIHCESGVYDDKGGSTARLSFFDLAVELNQYRDFTSAVNGIGFDIGLPPSSTLSLFAGKAVGPKPPVKPTPEVKKPAPGWPTFAEAVESLRAWDVGSRGGQKLVGFEVASEYLYGHDIVMIRFEKHDDNGIRLAKSFRPFHRGADGLWRSGKPSVYPLYGLESLPAEGTAYFFEGEKCRDLAVGIGLPSVACAHGAQSPHLTDHSPLAGRDVAIVCDAGIAGLAFAKKLSLLLAKLSPPARVRKVILPGLVDKEDVEEFILKHPDEGVARGLIEALGHADPEPDPEPDPESVKATGFDLGILGMTTFANAHYPREWLIKRILVKGKPCVVGGPKKTLKTSFVVDLVVSLGGAGEFLGQFDVPRPVKTLVISGESGEATIQETMRRICRAKDLDPFDLEGNVFWGFTLPQLSDAVQLAALGEYIRANGIECVVIDPLYLCLIGGSRGVDMANLFQVGPLLKNICDLCTGAGATPLLVHHFKKAQPLTATDMPDMEDLAFAGIQEFARQWILLKRRKAYRPGSGDHELWLCVGGSDGHSGSWSVNVSEGILEDDFRDRGWEVSIEVASEVIGKEKEQSAEAKAQKVSATMFAKEQDRKRKAFDDAEEALAFVKKSPGQACTKNTLKDGLSWNAYRSGDALALLLKQGRIDHVESLETVGKDDRKRSSPGYRFLTDKLPDEPE